MLIRKCYGYAYKYSIISLKSKFRLQYFRCRNFANSDRICKSLCSEKFARKLIMYTKKIKISNTRTI